MTAAINRVPQGLLGLLDLKAQGQNPQELAGYVQSTIDLTQLYALASRDTASSAVAVAGLGLTSFPALAVPQGELRVFYNISASMSAPPLPAAAQIRFRAGILPAEANLARLIGFTDISILALVGEDPTVAWTGAYIGRPGDTPGIWVTTFAGAPGGVRMNVNFSRFLI